MDDGMKLYRMEPVEGNKPQGGVLQPGHYAFADERGVVLALAVDRPTRGRELADAMQATPPATRLGSWYRVEGEGL